MRKNRSQRYLSAALLSLLLLFFFSPIAVQAQTHEEGCADVDTSGFLFGTFGAMSGQELSEVICQPSTRITIPGLNFTDPSRFQALLTQEEDTGSLFINIPFLGEYLAAVYRYAVVTAGLVAVIAIIVSGVQWILGGTNEELINKAKKQIGNALVGLLLAVGSYVILFTINPELVEFKSLRILYVEGQPLEFTGHDPDEELLDLTGEFSHDNWEGQPEGTTVASYVNRRTGGIRTCEVLDDDTIAAMQRAPNTYSFAYFGHLDPCTSRRTREISEVGLHLGSRGGSDECSRTVNTLFNRAVSTHYTIGLRGKICQFVDEDRMAWHGANNGSSIGIDLEHDGDPWKEEEVKECLEEAKEEGKDRATAVDDCTLQYTDAQYNSLARLLSDIASRHSEFTIDDTHVLSHCEINPSGRNDPPGFDWSRIGLNESEHDLDGECPFYNLTQSWVDEIYTDGT